MNKRKTLYGRVMALVLAFVMVCSSLGTSTITAYAAGSTGNIVTVETDTTQTDTTEVSVSGNETVETETVIEETSQEESEDDGIVEETTVTEEVEKVSVDSLANTEAVSLYNAEGEESTYTGRVEDDDWGKRLVINEGDMEEAGMTISAETIVSIIETERSEEDSFSVVELNMNSITDAIDTEVWNAVVNAVDSSLNGEGRTELRYIQSGGDAADENWCFGNPTVTEGAITFGVTYSAGNAGEGVSVQLDSVSIPADDASLGLYTDENRGNYSSIIAALGEGAVGRVYDSEGTLADNLWANIEKGSFDDKGQEKGTINISVGNIKDFKAGDAYLVKAENYTGKIEGDWCGDRLTIEQWVMEEAGIEVTDQAFIDIINAQDQKFGIVEFNLNSVRESISKDLWNAAVAVVEANENGECEIRFNMWGDTVVDKNWNFERPEAIAEDGSDITLAATWSAGEAGEGITVSFANNEFPADEVYLNLYTDQNRSDYDTISEAVGTNSSAELYNGENTVENAGAKIERDSFEDNGNEIPTLNISVGNIKNLSVNTEYVVKSVAYRGHVEGDWCGDRLTIEQWVMEEAGIEVTDQAFIDIINAQEQTFGIVEFNLNSVRESISKDLWNAAVAVVEADENGDCEIRFIMRGDTVVDKNWNFVRPEAIAEEGSDITLAATWSAGEAGEGITVSFANNEFPADEVYLNLYTDQNRSDYDTISEAVGTNSSAELYNGENTVENAGAKIERDSFEDNGNEIPTLNISVGNIKNLSVNTEYVVKSVAYRGHVEGDWCGDRLTIEQWVMEEAGIEVTDQALIDIINAQDQKFGIVEFDLNSVRESISKDLWNAAVAVVEADENGNCQIRFIMSGDNAADTNWNFDRPTAIAEEGSDITLAANWSAGEAGEGITVSFANNEFPADEVYLNLHTDQNRSDYGTISEAVGTKNSAELYNGENTVENAGAKIERNSFEDNGNEIPTLNISVGNIKNLSVNTGYVVKSVDYTGRLENLDGWECLWITYYEAGKEEAFTAEEIKDILAANESVAVNEVYIEQPYDSENVSNNIIDGSVVNAALPLLKGDEDSFISFAFSDDNAKRTFKIFNPRGEATETTVSVDAGIHVIGEDESTDAFVWKNGQVSFDGLDVEREDLEIVLSRESDNGKALTDLFGESNRQLALVDDSTDIYAEYRVEENELFAYISGSDKMEDEKEYKLSIAEYKGIVEDNVLFIYPWHVEPYGLEYTEELIVEILEDYAEQPDTKFARVEIGFVDEESAYNESDISAEVYNAAIKVTNPTMDSPNDNLGIGFKYIWYKADGTIVWNYYWDNGMNPAELEEDIKMQYQIGFDENGNVIMTTNIPELSDTYVDLEFVPNDFEGPDLTDDLKTYFGDVRERNSYILSPIPEMDYVLFQYGAYREEDSRVQILIERIDVLENNTVYEVLPYNFGHEWVDTWEDGTEYGNLYISASEIGKDTFDKGDIERSLTFRKYLKNKFDCIYIEQGNSYDDKGNLDNIIRKEDYNYIRNNFLNTDNENASIVYVFDNSDEDKNGIYLQDQVRYEFMNPASMTKDMDASVNFAGVEKYDNNGEDIYGGIDVYMPRTTVPASGVNVQIHADEESFSGKMLCNSLGDNGDDGTMCKIITDKKTLATLANDVWLGGYTAEIEYKDEKLERPIHQFHISDAQKLPQNAYSRIYPVQGRGDDVLYLAKKEALETSVSGTDILWKSFTPDTATVAEDAEGNYYIEPINEGIALYGSYCLTDDETPIVEIFGGRIEKKAVSMKFTNASVANPMEMELPPNGETWDALNHLDLRFFPTGTGLDNSELEWEVDSDCIEFMVDNQGNPNGEIKAVKAGEAIITVTAKNDSTLEATAKVIVKPAVVDEIKDILDSIQILAIDGYDKTLADLADELPEGFAWVDGKTTITEYKNMFCYGFPAIYTSPEDERTAEVNLPVMICDVESVLTVKDEFSIENGGVLDNGSTADLEILSYTPIYEGDVNGMNDMLSNFGRDDIRFTVSATSNPKNILVKDEEKEGLYHFTANSEQKGKKTFTLSLNIVDEQSQKVTTFKKLSSSITVVGKPLFDWQSYLHVEEDLDYNVRFHKIPDGSNYPVAHDAMSIVGEKGVFVITQPADSYYKITAKSLDTAVCKLGSVKVTNSEDKSEKITTIPYEIKQGGTAFIQLTAADEVKSTERISFEVFDMMPKAVSNAATIDVTMEHINTEVKWQMFEGTTLGTATVSGKGSEYFDVLVTEQDNDTAIIGITLNNRSIKTGKYKLDITVPVTKDDRTENFTTTVTVTVKASKPVYTAKQTAKVNLYYNEDKDLSQGILTLSDNVLSVNLENQDTAKGKICDYVITEIDDNPTLRAITLKNGGDSKNTNGKLVLDIDGVNEDVEVNISIKTENKKPDLVLTSKSSTVYPNYGQNTFDFKVINKKTGENAHIDTLEIQNKDGSWTSLNNDEPATIIGKNNTYNITYSDDYISGYATTQKKATDKLYIRVKPQGTTSIITLNYSVKVDPAIPALVPSSKTLTLNMNEEFYRSQSTTTTLSLKGTAVSFVGFSHETGWIEITGADAKAIAAKNANLDIHWMTETDENGKPCVKICARVNDNDSLKTGSYKYNVTLHQVDCKDISCQITVKVVDVEPSKCLSVSSKGSIDVLDRYTSAVTYTPKIKNLQGTLRADFEGHESYLKGPDAYKFATMVEGNALCVYARDGEVYSTKQTYYVTPVFVYENEDGQTFEIEGKQQKIKVKQGKPKVTITSPEGNTLYRERSNELNINLDALLNKKLPVHVHRIELTNYIGDLNCDYNNETGIITLSQYDINQIVASGKSWNLKFNVYYEDRAVNEKPVQVTYKLVVK